MSSEVGSISAPSNGEGSSGPDNGQSQSGESDSPSGRSTSAGSGLFSLILSGLGRAPASVRDTIEEALRSQSGTDTTFSAAERSMLLRMLRYGGLRVEDVMVPRADIIAADESETVADVLRLFVEAGVSRIPLYHETLDDPRGVLHIKDLLGCLVGEAEAAAHVEDMRNGHPSLAAAQPASPAEPAAADGEEKAPFNLGAIDLNRTIASLKVRRNVEFVPPSMPAMALLIRMQTTRSHLALVVDEYGGTDGLVTIEDLVEQIVGDIEDEHDEDDEVFISEDAAGHVIASARTPIEELEAHVGLKLLAEEDEDDVDTVGGLVFSLVARVPSRGEIIPHPSGIEFEILEADPRRIKKLRVHRDRARAPAGD